MLRVPLITCCLTLFGTMLWSTEYTTDEIIEIANDAGVSPDVLMIAGDVEYGEYLSGECTTCHQLSGASEGIPAIVGYDEIFFKAAMHAYKSKAREHPVMQMIAGRLDQDEIAALAAYFSKIEPQ